MNQGVKSESDVEKHIGLHHSCLNIKIEDVSMVDPLEDVIKDEKVDSNFVENVALEQKDNVGLDVQLNFTPLPFEFVICDSATTQPRFLQHCHTDKNNIGCELLQCSECEFMCKRKSSLKRHISNKHSIFTIYSTSLQNTGDVYHCFNCSLVFSTVQCLNKHKKYCSCKASRRQSKGGTEQSTPDTDTRVEKRFVCDLCNYWTTVRSVLKGHICTHSDNRPYACHVCRYRGKHQGALRRHMLSHTGKKRFACAECEFSFTTRSHLNRHVLTHSGEKPYACFVCEYRCTQQNILNRHMLTHTGEKPYACVVCEFKCRLKYSLKQHMRIHTGEKPYTCVICKYKCSKQGDLQRHMFRHTGEKPFACVVCGYRYTRKSYLEKHMLTHVGKMP